MAEKKIKYNKKIKTSLVATILCGLLFFSLGTGLLFGLYRPFVPWQKFECSFEDGTIEKLDDNNTFLYRYEVDGVLYEKVFNFVNYGKSHAGNINDSWQYIYVNSDNPYDVKRGVFNSEFLGFVIFFMVAGVGIIGIAIYNYKSIIKKQKRKK